MGTIALKIDKLNETKEKLKQELLFKGFTEEEIGPEFSKMANCIKTIGNANLPQWFKDSIVCWYDPKRLRMTNEEMLALKEASKPLKLIDFSGNGLDMDLRNFSWGYMSGIGGYPIYFTNLYNYRLAAEITITPLIFKINKILINKKWILGQYLGTKYKEIPSYTIKITNIPDLTLTDNRLMYGNVTLLKNGTYKLPKLISPENQLMDCGFHFLYNTKEEDKIWEGLIIEILPEYPNALVFDGIDDFGLLESEKLLLMTDYTVIVKRKRFSNNGVLCSNCNEVEKVPNYINEKGLFVFESGVGNNRCETRNFGKFIVLENFEKSDISYQTSNYYNNIKFDSINFNQPPYNKLLIGKSLISSHALFNGILYNFLLFNKTLTPEQIEWVKTNIVDPVDKLEFQSEYQNN